MSKIKFTDDQVKKLNKNPNVVKASNKAITYSYEFKKKFIQENKNGKLPRIIFQEAGFDIETIGLKRIQSSGKRWRKAYRDKGAFGLKDKRDGVSGRPLKRALTPEEEIEKLKAQVEYLKIENDFLKKLDRIERGET